MYESYTLNINYSKLLKKGTQAKKNESKYINMYI